jgi:hypothetical protein
VASAIARPHGHGKTTTFTAGLRIGIAAPGVIDGPMDGDAFYVTLVPELKSGDVVVMDNLACQRHPGSDRGRGRDAPLPYAPDLTNRSFGREAFAKLKAFLRAAAARTIPDLPEALKDALDIVLPLECQNYFATTGYKAIGSENALAALFAVLGLLTAFAITGAWKAVAKK